MFISIDMGGTNTRVASSKDLTSILRVEKFKTQNTLEKQKKRITKAVINVSENEKVESICIGVPGLIDRKNNKFGNVVNFPVISNLEFDSLFGEQLKPCTIIGENDAALAGLGEAIFGAGINHKIVAYLTISTGVGGIRIQDKKLNRSQNYSEPGRQIIIIDGLKDTKVDMHGTLDAYTSGQAFKKNYGIATKDCNDQDIWNDYTKKLSAGIINILALWAPDIVILGGGISNKFEQYIKTPLLENITDQYAFDTPKIVKSKLEDACGIYGGFALIKQLQSKTNATF